MRVRSLALVAITAALAMSTSGCAAVKQAVQPKPTVVTKEGPVASADAMVTGELPAGLPEGLPLWPGATIDDGVVEDGNVDLKLSTTDSFEEVVAGLGVGFERAGWEVVESLADDTNTVLEVSDGTFEGVVTITAGADVGTAMEYVLVESE